MSDIPGGGAVDRSRPDDEPTINAAGADGFLVDGTDSFAVPGPIDVVPAEEVPESPAVSRTRVLVTAGAVAAGLAFVIAVGRGGAGDAGSSLRADGAEAPGFAFSNWGADAGDVVLVVPQPADEDTLRRLEDGEVASDGSRATTSSDEIADEDLTDDAGYDTYDVSIPSYPEYDDETFGDDDVDFPSYRPTLPRRTTSPQRLPVIPSPRVTTPAVVTTTTPEPEPDAETTTTTAPPAEETTTTSSSPPTTAPPTTPTTPTTPAPSPAWAPAAQGLPDCPTALHVWARGDGLVAAVGATLYQQSGTTWSPLGVAIPGTTAVRAFVPGDASRFMVATDAGVFATTDNGATYVERGDLADVRALAVGPSASSMLAVTGADQLLWWDGVAGRWVDVTEPAPAGTFGQVLFLDDATALLGTTTGVYRSIDAGQNWTSVSSSPVVGDAVRVQDTYYWLLADGAGVLRSNGLDAASWTMFPGAGAVAADARALAVRSGQLLTWGDPDGTGRLISSGDGGASWVALDPTTPFRPDGLVHAGTATVAFRTDCAAGGSDSVVRLADP